MEEKVFNKNIYKNIESVLNKLKKVDYEKMKI